MGEAAPLRRFLRGVQDGLMFSLGSAAKDKRYGYGSVGEGEAMFLGTRPRRCVSCEHEGPTGIHAHGFTGCRMVTYRMGGLRPVWLLKRRWLCVACGLTWHLRPPDQLRGVGVCTLVYVVFLWAVVAYGMDGAYEALPKDACDYVEVATLARWLPRACAASAETEEAIREAVGKKSEPGPDESAFTTGLSPPAAELRRCRPEPPQVAQLCRSFAMIEATYEFDRVPYTRTLAQARAAADKHHKRFLA